MIDDVAALRNTARSIEAGADLGDLSDAAIKIRNAADEIERLRGVLIDINNRWRHEFERDVSEAADKLFKKLSANKTDPFGRKG